MKTKFEKAKEKLPTKDPKYITFLRLQGILGEVNEKKMRDERIDELITKHCKRKKEG